MIKRLLLVLVGVVAAAFAIAASTNAVDIADSTIEDGDSRWILVVVGAVVFLACLFWLIADLAATRRAKEVDEPAEGEDQPTPDTRSLADRLATKPPTGTGANTIQRGPITVTQPSAPAVEPGLSTDRVGSRLFDPAAQSVRSSQAGGLFGDRLPGAAPAGREIPTSPPESPAQPAQGSVVASTSALTSEPRPAPGPAPTPEPSTPPPATPPPGGATPAPEPPDSQPIALRDYDPDDIDRTIDDHKRLAVDSLVASGTLSTEGPLTADDIRTMLFIALSSEQLRSILHEARDDEPVARMELRESADNAPQATTQMALDSGPAAEPHPDDQLPRWHVVDERGDAHGDDANDDAGADADPGDDDPPSTGYLYATGGN